MDLDTPNTDVKVGDKVQWQVGYTDATVVLVSTEGRQASDPPRRVRQ